MADDSTDFGFERIPSRDKARRVRGVFDTVAPKYDLMNDLMSGGLHRLWKARLVDVLAPRPGQAIVDVAGGTGDVATRIHARMTRGTDAAAAVPVTVCDINAEMLNQGRDRA